MTKQYISPEFREPEVHSVCLPELTAAGVSLWLLRIDQLHPAISGNKWYKLKYNLKQAIATGCQSVVSFGGAYSNHIHALAWAAQDAGIKSVGVIRGEPEYVNNPTLHDAREWGMDLLFVNRRDYRLRKNPEFIANLAESLTEEFKPAYIIPEGGSNALAVKGCTEILSNELIQQLQPDRIILPCGTGGTLTGIALSQPALSILGIPVLKNAGFLYADIRELISSAGAIDPKNWQLDLHGHYGGYGKCPEQLLVFMDKIQNQCGIMLDQVYTGKMLLRILDLVAAGNIPRGSKLLAVHTGGLQGRRSIDSEC